MFDEQSWGGGECGARSTGERRAPAGRKVVVGPRMVLSTSCVMHLMVQATCPSIDPSTHPSTGLSIDRSTHIASQPWSLPLMYPPTHAHSRPSAHHNSEPTNCCRHWRGRPATRSGGRPYGRRAGRCGSEKDGPGDTRFSTLILSRAGVRPARDKINVEN